MRWRTLLLALVAGAVQVFAFAPFGWLPLSFLSLAVLYVLWQDSTPYRAALLGYVWGLGCFLGGVSWVYVSMHDVGGMPAPVAALMTLLFATVLATFPALSGWLAARLRVQGWSWIAPFVVAAAWTVGELLRGHVATGFPWLAVGYAQSPPSPLAGYAPLLGVYGVGFVVSAISAALAQIFCARRCLRPALLVCIVLPIVGFALRSVSGSWITPQGAPFTASLLQGDVPQSLKWDPQHLELSLRVYAELAQAHPAQLMVLPETAIPLLLEQIPKSYLHMLSGNGQQVLLGAAVAIDGAEGKQGYANGAVMLTPQLQQSTYFKRHLVPFGEYVPRGFHWFLNLMHIPMSDFSAGAEHQEALIFDGQKIAPNICYEDLFGEEMIADVPQATLLINLSNTAWFGHSLAQPQHLQIAQMRAMETGRMILRATNTGMTAAVNPDGTVAAVLLPFTRDALTVTAQGYTGITPYVRIGNAGIEILVLVILGFAGWKLRKLKWRGSSGSL